MRQLRKVIKKINWVAVVAGGSEPTDFISEIKKAGLVVGVDRGAYWLVSRGIRVDIAIGDFDSVTEDELGVIEVKAAKVIRSQPEKDATDLELAIDEVVKLQPEMVTIYGAIGSRFDQSLQSIFLLELLMSHNVKGKIVNETNEIYLTNSKLSFLRPLPFPYLSVVPISDQVVVNIVGCKYPLKREVLYRMHSRGISNVVAHSPAEVVVQSGTVAVILSRD